MLDVGIPFNLMSPHRLRIALGCASLAVGLFASAAHAQSVVYTDFSNSSGLQLNGSASIATTSDGKVLRLTPANFSQSGSAFSTTQINLTNNSFSTAFSFRITNPFGGIGDQDGLGADGLTFTMQTVSNTSGGAGGGIGYQGIPHSIAIEYDTYDNGEINGNHVGVDTNGALNDLFAFPVSTRLNDGNLWYSWIDYNGTTHDLQVRLSQTSIRPTAAIISTTTLDLASILGQNSAYVGFTSGTGAGFGNHDIVSWQFNNSFRPITTIGAPDSGSTVFLLGLGLLPLMFRVRRSKK
jgi:hypothetical protein